MAAPHSPSSQEISPDDLPNNEASPNPATGNTPRTPPTPEDGLATILQPRGSLTQLSGGGWGGGGAGLRTNSFVAGSSARAAIDLRNSRGEAGTGSRMGTQRNRAAALSGANFPVLGFTGRFCGFYNPCYNAPFVPKAKEFATATIRPTSSQITPASAQSGGKKSVIRALNGKDVDDEDCLIVYHKVKSADLKYLREISKYKRSAFPAAERHTFFKFRADVKDR